jgi:hypothetical protein
MTKRTPLTSGPRELAMLTGKPAPSYRALWGKIVNGELPAEQVNGRYFIDVEAIASALGMLPAEPGAGTTNKPHAE